MKLIFDGVTFGGGPNLFLDDNYKGLDAGVDNTNIRIPRTDYFKNISVYLNERIRPFSGTLVGDDVDDFRTRKRALNNKIGGDYIFTLVDDYINADGTTTTFATYEFDGRLIDVQFNNDLRSNFSKYQLQILCEDPFLRELPAVSNSVEIEESGFVFPLIFPFLFTGGNNTLTVNNTGLATIYPTITCTGGFTNLTIIAESSSASDRQFKYNSTVSSGQDLVITPVPTDPIKARLEGVSVIQFTNNNFDVLKLTPGNNTFTFIAESGLDANTAVQFDYYNSYKSL